MCLPSGPCGFAVLAVPGRNNKVSMLPQKAFAICNIRRVKPQDLHVDTVDRSSYDARVEGGTRTETALRVHP